MNKKQFIKTILTAVCVLTYACALGQNCTSLQRTIEQIVKNKKMTIGVAVYNARGEKLASINSDKRFAQQSVYKLPIAMAYLDSDSVDCFSRSIKVSKRELLPNTWSPFREVHPNGATIAAMDLLDYVVAKSDNNLCDIMIDLAGGVDSIDSYIKRIGVNNIAVRNYEREIQSSWDVQFENYASPKAIVDLLQYLWNDKQLGSLSSEALWQVMRNTKTGSARALLSQGTDIGYKTGFSGKSHKGITAANNCVGIIDNNGKDDIIFAIFITDSSEDEEVNYSIISQIVKAIE